MKTVYRMSGYLIAALVMVQAAAVAYGYFGLAKWIDEGGTLDKATIDSTTTSVTGAAGLAVHGILGSGVIPLVSLLFVVCAVFAKIPGGVRWALITFGTAVVEVVLGFAAQRVPILGLLHGILALVLFGVAVTAAMRVTKALRAGPAAAADSTMPAEVPQHPFARGSDDDLR